MSDRLRTAAVLLPVFRDAEEELRIVLVVRADDGGQHGGQLGLPGGKPEPELWLEPGRSLVGPAGVTLYRVGSVKRLPGRTWVAVDGGMSDNPRPQLYDARYTALSATRLAEPADEGVSVAGMHCESGDVLIDDVALPSPRRGDLLAVPATGAYTLAMASNYNGVTRPAAVLVRDGSARVIRRRENIDDLLRHEAR